MIFDCNKVTYLLKKYKKMLALFDYFATIDLHKVNHLQKHKGAR